MLTDLLSRKEMIESLLSSLEMWAWICAVIVVIGVAGEAVVGIRVLRNSKELRGVQKQIDRLVDADTASTRLKIASANERVAVANERAAELEFGQGPWRLSAEERLNAVQVLSKFSGQRFCVLSYLPPPPLRPQETDFFMDDLTHVLLTCGWVRENVNAVRGTLRPVQIPRGVCIIQTNPADAGDMVIQQCMDALRNMHLGQMIDFPLGSVEIPPHVIGIAVGLKPFSTIAALERQSRNSMSDSCQKICDAIKKYPKQKVQLQCLPGDDQSENWAKLFQIAVFEPALWSVEGNSLSHRDYALGTAKMEIAVSEVDNKNATIPEAAVSLLTAIKDAGIVEKEFQLTAASDIPTGTVRVRIGVSPELPRGTIADQPPAPSNPNRIILVPPSPPQPPPQTRP